MRHAASTLKWLEVAMLRCVKFGAPLALSSLVAFGAGSLAACSGSDGDGATHGDGGGVYDAGPGDDDAATADGGAGNDGGPASDADAGHQDCSRRAQVKNAPASLYDAFAADIANITDATAKTTRVDKFIADVRAQGGTPLESPGDPRAVFLVRGAPPSGPWSVAGSFRPGQPDWKANPLAMTQVAGTDLYVADTTVPRGSPAQYKLLSGTQDTGFQEDMLAMNVVWDGIDHQAPGQFNGIVHQADADMSKGRIVAYRSVHSQTLNDNRDVFAYVPPRYDDGSCAPLPHLLVHDGNESLTRGDFAGVANTTYAQTPDASAILVFVALPDQNVRMDEYTYNTSTALGDKYGTFLATEVEPEFAARYRFCEKTEDRGLSGASLGGLISTYLAFQHSDVWGYVGSQSGSLFWDNSSMVTRGGADPVVKVRFYLDHGCPNDNCDSNRAMVTALNGKGYEVDHVEVANAQHAWSYWHDRFGQALTYFRQGKPVCK